VEPSLSEGLGSAVIDAMGTGLPVIGSRVGRIQEPLGNGAGLLVPPGDPQALAGAIAALVQAPDRCVALGHTALIRVKKL
jgi:glycosyltransferase involved in cell wall biosynthesis